MIKSYIYVNGNIVTKGEKDIESVVLYYDNFKERFIVQNEIEFLSSSLAKDEKSYTNKIENRDSSWNLYKKIAPLVGVASVAAPFVLSTVMLIGNRPEYVSTVYGNMEPYTGAVATSLPVTILVGQIFASLELVSRPSKREIAGTYEMVRYEKKTLENKQKLLLELEKDTRKVNEANYSESGVMQVDDSQIRRHKENFKLRYAYGAHRKDIYEMYKNGILLEEMKKQGFGEEAMADYMIFVEQEFSKVDDIALTKKNF